MKIYKKNDEEENFIKLIEPLIWKQNELTGKVYKNKILIDSKVVIAQDNDTFHRILKTAELDYKAKDRYSKNFIEFARLFNDYCKTNPLKIYDFITIFYDTRLFCRLKPIIRKPHLLFFLH